MTTRSSNTEDDFILRPVIRLVEFNPEEPDFAEPLGDFGFEVFWGVPAVGDTLNEMSDLGVFGPVRVKSRHFFLDKDRPERTCWVLVVAAAKEDPRLVGLHAEITRHQDEAAAAWEAEISKALREHATKKKRRAAP